MQAFQGNVIAGRYRDDKIPNPGSTFKVRRVSYGIGVERIVPYHSPLLESVKVTRRGKVRRSRLYYLRGLDRPSRSHQGATLIAPVIPAKVGIHRRWQLITFAN